MKKATALLALAFVSGLFNCKKDDGLGPGFDMIFREEFSIPAGLSTFVVHHFYFENVPSFYQNLLAENQKTDGDITAILPTKSVLSGVFGDASFDFAEEVSAKVYLPSEPTFNPVEFAYRYPTPLDPGNQLDLIPGTQDVKKFLSKDRFAVDLSFRLRKTTVEETTVRFDFQFKATY